jgi:hypothetical protein
MTMAHDRVLHRLKIVFRSSIPGGVDLVRELEIGRGDLRESDSPGGVINVLIKTAAMVSEANRREADGFRQASDEFVSASIANMEAGNDP